MGPILYRRDVHVVNCIVALIKGQSEEEKSVIVWQNLDVANFPVLVLRNIKYILVGINLNPVVAKHKPYRFEAV